MEIVYRIGEYSTSFASVFGLPFATVVADCARGLPGRVFKRPRGIVNSCSRVTLCLFFAVELLFF